MDYKSELRELDKILENAVKQNGLAGIPATLTTFSWRWDYLADNGYLQKNTTDKYSITPKGRMMVSTGGLVKKFERDNASKNLFETASYAAILIFVVEFITLLFGDQLLLTFCCCE